MNTTVKLGVGLTIPLLISVACAENVQYSAVVYAPANISVIETVDSESYIDGPS